MSGTSPIVVIGAGPAGIAASRTLVEAGHTPILIDEGMFAGGQIFRRPPVALRRSDKDLYGFDAPRARSMHNQFSSILPSIVYRPETLVWSVEPGVLHLSRKSHVMRQPWNRLIVAPGAMDRIIPIKGWTAPGVFTLGAAQIALKAQASLIGREVILVGSGPLLYLVAYQYARAGGHVIAVLESSIPFRRLSSVPALVAGGKILVKGLYYIAWLRTHGIRVETDVEPLEIIMGSNGRVSGVRFRQGGRETTLGCDAVGLGYGLKSETHLADLLGVDFHFDRHHHQWLPKVDSDGRSSIERVYLAGDGLAVRGSEVAEMSGELAALTLLADEGQASTRRIAALRRRIAQMDRFRRALDEAFPLPCQLSRVLPDDVILCRCEGLTAGSVREAVAASGEYEINRIKAFTRVGMGRCQGRLCASTTCELIAAQAGVDIRDVGRMRGQAPAKPLTLSTLAGGTDDDL